MKRRTTYTLCPRCEAEQAIERMRQLEASTPSPDVNWYAHSAGIAHGVLESLIAYPLELCANHREP